MIHYRSSNKGLIKTIILVIIVLIILAYLGLNLRTIVNSSTFQDNWVFIRDMALMIWNNYLREPLTYFWNTIFVPLVLNPAAQHLQHLNATSTQSGT